METIEHIPQAPTDLNRHSKIGYILIFITLVIFVWWGNFARLDSGAIANGEVIPSDKVLTIQHKEGGIIRKIDVKDGESVKKGDILLELDILSETSELAIGEIDKNSLEAFAKRLEAERDGRPISPNSSSLGDNKIEYELFLSRKEGLNKDIEIFNKRIEQVTNDIKGTELEIESLKSILDSSKETLTMNKELYKNRFLDKRKLIESQNTVSDLEGRIGKKRAEIALANDKITEMKLQILRMKNEWRNDVLERLKQAKDSLKINREKIKIISDKVKRGLVIAPAEGKIHGLKFNTLGGVIKAGEDILQIVPQDEKLVVEAKIMPDDIDTVHIGLKAFVRISAYKQRTHNAVQGTVIDLSPNTFKDPATNMGFYKGLIEIDQTKLNEAQKMILQPGMLAQVEIVTGERSPIQYMIQPFIESFRKAFKEE